MYRAAVIPYVCNVEKRRIQHRTEQLLNMEVGNPAAAAEARNHLTKLNRCIRVSPTEVDTYMIAAANHRVLKRWDHAITMYSRALRFDHRPEIYLQLGLTELAAGRREDALQHLVAAARFDIYNVWRISDVEMRERVRTLVLPPPTAPGVARE